MTYWEFTGRELVNCTCEYGCPCQFNALPDKGHCYAVAGIQIDKGKHGETALDGLKIGAMFKWPGAIHEGNGEALAFVDERASEEQREALLKIMTGQDTDPFATMFAVYASTGMLDIRAGWIVLLSLVPFLGPFMMLSRISDGAVQPWEIVVSVALLLAVLGAALWLAARIYRAGVLLYGQRPGVLAVWRMVRSGV